MFFQKIDEMISSWMLNIHGSSIFNYLMKIFSILGEGGLIWIVFLLVILIFVVVKKRKVPVVLLAGAVVLLMGWLFNDFCLKLLIQRVRPYRNETVFGDSFISFMNSIHYSYPSGYSFPSGHSFSGFNAATSITLYKKKLGFIAYPLAFIIAFSRIFLGAHYFSDVLIGSFLGVCFSFLGYFIGNKIFKIKKISESKYATR